jgi:urease accessory protein
MLQANKLIPQGRGLSRVLLQRASSVELDWDVRQKSRFEATDSAGRHLGVFLPRGSVVRGGDVLVAEDGTLVVVHAAAQPVLVVSPCATHGSAFDLVRAAYHLGNRHVALELRPDHLKLEPDHVLADLLRQMHLTVTDAQAAFEPESGAYGATGAHASHGHAQDLDHDHGQPGDTSSTRAHEPHEHQHARDQVAPRAHENAPGAMPVNTPSTKRSIPIQPAATPHVHGPGCGHDH